jgi:hypothetical protein
VTKAFEYAEIAVPTDAVLAFNYVRTFLEVADAGGVSPAARRLGVSKSIVSRRLARLEQALVSNFYRAQRMGLCLQKPSVRI